MRFSIVVIFYNSEKTLPLCLKALANQSRMPDELILVDNGSIDSSRDIARRFSKNNQGLKVIVVSEEERGLAPARNRGVSFATGDVIVFTDSDCVPDENWLYGLEQIFKEQNSSSLGGVAGKIRGYQPKNTVQKFLSLFTLRTPQEKRDIKEYNLIFGGFATANLAIKKDIFKEVGSFDENPLIPEDHDLCARIYKKGYSIFYSPKPTVYHIHRSSLWGMLKQSFAFGKKQGGMLKKHFRKMMVVEFPRKTIINSGFPGKLWLNLNSADKKIIFLLLIGLFYPLSLILIPLYLGYLLVDVGKRLRKETFRANLFERLGIVGFLFLKSFAMGLGRLYSSLKLGVLCL